MEMIHSPDLFFIVLLFIISGARSRPVHTHWCIRWQAPWRAAQRKALRKWPVHKAPGR